MARIVRYPHGVACLAVALAAVGSVPLWAQRGGAAQGRPSGGFSGGLGSGNSASNRSGGFTPGVRGSGGAALGRPSTGFSGELGSGNWNSSTRSSLGQHHGHHHGTVGHGRHFGHVPFSARIYVSPYAYTLGYPAIGIGTGWTGVYGIYPGYGYYGSRLYGSPYYRSYSHGVYGYGPDTGLGIYSYPPPYDSFRSFGGTTTVPPPAAYEESDRTRSIAPATSTDEYLRAARDSFRSGDYATAQRLANHAVVESPENAKAHEILSLAFLSQGDYRGAAAAAHAAVASAPVADWPTLYRYYLDRDKYTQHLRDLQRFVKENPDVFEVRFLLGVHYMMLGHRAEAKEELAQYLRRAWEDPVATRLFTELGGKLDEIPRDAAEPGGGESPPPVPKPPA
jgi:hypothetical protein